MSWVHLEVTIGAARRRGKLHLNRESGVVQFRLHGERTAYTGHVSELAECLYNLRCRELAREAVVQKAIKRRGGGRP